MTKPVHFTRGSRKHRIGRAHARYVMANQDAVESIRQPGDVTQLDWVGTDERGRELHIVALDLDDVVLVIHVMPTSFETQED